MITGSPPKTDDDESTMMRTDTPFASHTSDLEGDYKHIVIADGNTNYLQYFNNRNVPDEITIRGVGVTR